MSLEPGTLTLTLEYGHNLRDVQWFGRQDPYCVLTVGSRTVKSRVHTDGGRNPVWNQTFQFSVINESNVHIQVKDEEVFDDTYIGSGNASLARARTHGSDRQQVPIITRRGKTRGFVQVAMTFVRHISPSAAAYAMATVQHPSPQPQPLPNPVPAWGSPPPYGYNAAPAYGAPYPGYPPPPQPGMGHLVPQAYPPMPQPSAPPPPPAAQAAWPYCRPSPYVR